ncbi:MAG TPA: DUF5658 family protein, partial [Blastocatellia bacterium]|nr:DUF5658 family protein [Blastocatellia bacterium]
MANPKTQAIRINSMSAFDAASTLFLVFSGYSTELNPFMNAMINYHPLFFVLFKITITLGA